MLKSTACSLRQVPAPGSSIQHAPFPQPFPQLRFEEFAHAHVLAQAFAPARLDDEIPGRAARRGHLERLQLDVPIERVARDDAPLVEDERDAGLALRVDPHVRFEAEAVDDRHQAAHAVQWCARQRAVREYVSAPPREDGVEGRDGIGGAGHGDQVQRFEQARGRRQERGVERAARGRDDLARAAGDGVGGEGEVGEFESCVANGCKGENSWLE